MKRLREALEEVAKATLLVEWLIQSESKSELRLKEKVL